MDRPTRTGSAQVRLAEIWLARIWLAETRMGRFRATIGGNST